MRPRGDDLDRIAAEEDSDRTRLESTIEHVKRVLRPLTTEQRDLVMIMTEIRLDGLEAWDPVAQKKRLRVKSITRKLKAQVGELRRCGVRDPVKRAYAKIAEQERFASGPALNKWLRRNRRPGQKMSG